MADYLVTDTELTNIANAIRTKADTSGTLSFPNEFISAINDIEITPIQVTVSGGSVSKISGTTADYLLTMS